jgi:acyl-CoA thioesterase FadM
MDPLRLSFAVHSFDADAFGLLAPAALAGYLQEAAGRSAEALGVGFQALQARGLTWVLRRSRIVLDEPLRWGDELELETWPSGLEGALALRDFRLHRDGREVGRACTWWLAMDLRTRRPLRPDRVLPPHLHAPTPRVLEAPPAPGRLAQAAVERRFDVRYEDIDANGHVTNARYLAWAAEAVDEAAWRAERLASLDVQYVAECGLGQAVRSRSAPDGGGARLHAIVREDDGAELARVRTTWIAR